MLVALDTHNTQYLLLLLHYVAIMCWALLVLTMLPVCTAYIPVGFGHCTCPHVLQEEILKHVPIIYNQDRGYDKHHLPGKFWSAIDEMKAAYLARPAEFQPEPLESDAPLVGTRNIRGMTSESDKVMFCSSDNWYSIFSMLSMPSALPSGRTL